MESTTNHIGSNVQQHHAHHHSHHHTHYHVDQKIRMKNRRLSARERGKFISNILFVCLSIIAIIIMIFVVWMYSVE